MPKLILNTIVKNESHCILTMLKSAIQISDAIVIADTGSTDGTQEIIKKFGEENNIPTYVFERPFDDFEQSRNFGMDMARKVINELNWNINDCWTWWCDADETIIVDSKFDKSQFTKDLYMMNTYIGQMKYTRNTFARASKPFRFYGPIHEFIVCDDKTITSGLVENIHVDVKMIGASWQGDLGDKYLSHAHILEKYINKNRSDSRWIFYTAQSYHDSSQVKDNKDENEERLRRALRYYKERVSRNDGYPEERFYSQYRIGTIMRTLECPWNLTMQELLKAYAIEPLRAEPLKVIIDHYLNVGEWHLAYVYSKFCRINFHNKNPYPSRLLFIDQSLYEWKLSEVHSAACYYTNRISEAEVTYKDILSLVKSNPEKFTEEDLKKIESNSKFFIK